MAKKVCSPKQRPGAGQKSSGNYKNSPAMHDNHKGVKARKG